MIAGSPRKRPRVPLTERAGLDDAGWHINRIFPRGLELALQISGIRLVTIALW